MLAALVRCSTSSKYWPELLTGIPRCLNPEEGMVVIP